MDATLLAAGGTLAKKQSHGTQVTMAATIQLFCDAP